MTVGRDHLSKSESVRIAAIEAGVPLLVEAREIIGVFQAMICKKIVADLEPSLARASSSLIASFASGVVKDREAVIAGHLVTRQMYRGGKIDLLQARLSAPLSAAPPNVRQSQIWTPNDIRDPRGLAAALNNCGARTAHSGRLHVSNVKNLVDRLPAWQAF
jgi:hypothetical protein